MHCFLLAVFLCLSVKVPDETYYTNFYITYIPESTS